MVRGLEIASIALLVAGAATGEWTERRPDRNADRVVRLFKQVCVDHLGRSAEMGVIVERSGGGFRSVYAGNAMYGPVWDSPHGRIAATDHRHNHDGDECQLKLGRAVAPGAAATIAALRRQGLVKGRGEPAEFGGAAFRRGDTVIFVRYDLAGEATGVSEKDAGLTLLIQRPAG